MTGLPQTHGLTNAERSRLVRSNRKLQALLGETPHVIAAAQASHAHIPTEAIAPTTPETSSFSSAVAQTPSNRPRPQLLLHLQLPNHKHTIPLPSPTTPGTPLSPTNSITLNMQTPTPPTLSRAPSTKDLRRRHLAKLTRTLGENIAPELVPEPDARSTLQRAATTVGHGSFTSSSERLDVRTPAVVDDGSVVATPMSPPPSPWRSPSGLGRSFSAAVRTTRTLSRPPHRRRGSLVAFTQNQPREPRDEETRERPTSKLLGELKTGKRRKEKEWSGEWNREMQAVAQKLRALK
ncbi:hypothetical protein C8F04DRAFT_1399070 [Mycena alexandri]|uniref:Uncharacterized protein n=1 Tax=Mycena alexandri TaxID=1745969 RepID=A0AAD6WUY8_9AGAR|nr:hypothetical protein C8F04DRAFT_1399070 [Mycena alexandri]